MGRNKTSPHFCGSECGGSVSVPVGSPSRCVPGCLGSAGPFLSMSHRTTPTHWRVASTLLLASLVAGCASVRKADYPEEKAQIEQRLHDILDAAQRKDFSRLEGYHFYGPRFTRFSGSSPARQDAEATRQAEHDGLALLKNLKMRADTLKIDVFGAVGIATFILDYSFESGGETVRRKDRSTLVFVKDRGDWKIVHEHLSPIPPVEDGSAKGSRPIRSGTSPTAGSGR